MKETLQAMLESVFAQPIPRVYTLRAGDSLRKALARHEWKERHRAQRILNRQPKFARQ